MITSKLALTFSRLAQGHLDEALALAKGSNFESYALQMVAASDGPPAVRHGLDPAPYLEPIRKVLGEVLKPMMRFVEQVRPGQVPAKDQLKKLAIESRLRAYVFGAVALGSRALCQWRDSARFMLFASERPYFR